MAGLTNSKTTSKAKSTAQKPLTAAELGLEAEDIKEKENKINNEEQNGNITNVLPKETPAEKAKKAMLDAAAANAVKAAAEANSEMSLKEAEKTYIIEKKRDMLNRCKSDAQVEFVGQKILANYFGTVYTFTYNLIPVTVRFDGSKQYFPRFIYNRLMEKINEVSDSNTSKEVIEHL